VEYAPELFLYRKNSIISQRLKEFYLGNNISEINTENIQNFGQIFSDGIIGHGVHRLVHLARQTVSSWVVLIEYYKRDVH